MLKTLFFVLFVLFVRSVPAASLMSHEKFVHLNLEEQKKIVIATMQLVVAMEENYKHETRTTGFDAKRFQDYSEFMRRVSNLLFPEAHAARNVRYGQYLNELRNILSQNDKCLYAGWISTMGADNKCTHPAYSGVQKFREYYQAENGCAGDRNQITCNPAIFGFKNVYQKTLFCVPAGPMGAENSSRDCMRKALAQPPESGADSPDVRIQNMIQGIAMNPNDANAVFDFLIKACACEAKPKQISQRYHDYMRPHRTCLGILRMMAEVMPQCNSTPALMDQNQLSLLEHIKTSTQAQLSQENVESFYSPMVNEFVNRSDYQAVCGSAPSTGGGNNSQGQCVDEKNTVTKELCCGPNRKPKADKSACEDDPSDKNDNGNNGDGNNGGDGDEIVVTGKRPDPQTNPPGDNPDPGGNNDGNDGEEIVVTGRRPTPEEVQCSDSQRKVDGKCKSFCAERPASAAATVAAITTTPDAPAAPATPADPSKPATPAAPTPETPAAAPAKPDCVCKDETKTPDAEGFCPAPEKPADNKSTINYSVVINKEEAITVEVEAKVDPSDKKAEHTVIWFRTSSVNATINAVESSKTVKEVKDTVGLTPEAGETETPPPPAIDRSAPEGKTVLSSSTDGSWIIKAPRMPQDYEVCARFIKLADSSIAADNKCVKIKKTTMPAGGMRNPFGGMQMPTRGGASDAVFKGVR